MKKHSLGFIFNQNLDQVLLVHKTSPSWQKGLINGIGGKLENGEDSLSSIVRETEEESLLKTKHEDWVHLGVIHGEIKTEQNFVDVFALTHKGNLHDAQSGDVEVEWFGVDSLPKNVIPNLRWLIPLALDKIRHNEFKEFNIHY